ncbi:hypothetical protein [Streptomyces subrutilus]|uniref:Uncharacterized protein n=1 Tax=Streptomyces subrutilus TaxID=36818 RepID=A0A1E5Q064_9ACTN|nr:hypothetical protein [Streptomyces subrutilus]OEJ35070.1 hypothetical protein BGK67_30475 [Streptomyces subrutilus]
MILILGLIILIAALVVGLAGIFGNTGAGHELGAGGDFSVFGYHATGSTGSLFLSGMIVGAVALLGLTLVMLGARRSAVRSARARRELNTSRREAAAVAAIDHDRDHDRDHDHDHDHEQHDDPLKQRDDVPADDPRTAADTRAPVADAPRRRGHWFGNRAAPR